MKKILFTVVCLSLVLPAVPSFAYDHELGGYYLLRAQMMSNVFHPSQSAASRVFNTSNDPAPNVDKPAKLFDQRFRAKWTNNINEWVSVVYFGEIDFQWGDQTAATATRNSGGGAGGDAVNLETKNLYASIKIPETPVSVTLGLQGFKDNCNYAYAFGDASGIKVDAALEMAKLTFYYLKWFEGDLVGKDYSAYAQENDRDIYMLQGALTPAKDLKLNLGATYSVDKTAGHDLYWLSADATFAIAPVTVEVTGVYNFGEINDGDGNVSGYHLSARASAKAGDISGFVRAFYFSGDDDTEDENYVHSILGGAPPLFGVQDGLLISMANANPGDVNGDAALSQLAYTRTGLMGATAGGKYSFSQVKGGYAGLSVGYFQLVEDMGGDADLGFEISGSVGMTVADVVQLSANAATLMLGSAFDGSAPVTNDDPDNPYSMYLMAKVLF